MNEVIQYIRSQRPLKIWIDSDNYYYEIKYSDDKRMSMTVGLSCLSWQFMGKDAGDGFSYFRSQGGMEYEGVSTMRMFFKKCPKALPILEDNPFIEIEFEIID